MIINDDELVQKVRYLINFGIKNQEEIPHLGTNAKMNEFEAAMGLCVLDDIENIKEKTNKMLKQLETDIGAEEFNKILPDVSAIMSKFDLDGDFESYYKTLNSFLSNTLIESFIILFPL